MLSLSKHRGHNLSYLVLRHTSNLSIKMCQSGLRAPKGHQPESKRELGAFKIPHQAFTRVA